MELLDRLKAMYPKIPHMLLYGPSGSGKKTLLRTFLEWMYKDTPEHVVYVNCAHGKGIKFIREELKSFAKTNTLGMFKSIVLWNADHLTPDAQSALRRCIEVFSTHTRFFMVTEEKYKLLKPILSRLATFYVPLPSTGSYHLCPPFDRKLSIDRFKDLSDDTLCSIAKALYQDAYTTHEVVDLLAEEMSTIQKYRFLVQYDTLRRQCRQEVTLMMTLLYFYLHPN